MTLKQFIDLVRPHTLPASIAPILVAISMAWQEGESNLPISVLCILVGLSAQAFSNCCNDYYDFKRGADTPERVGFQRPLTMGALQASDVIYASIFWGIITATAGIYLCWITTPILLLLGASIILAAWLYSGGRYSLSYLGFGDFFVLLFYGWVSVQTTFFLLTHHITLYSTMTATSLGLAAVNILVVNNYRDYEEDFKANKKTLIVRLGREFAPKFYLTNILLVLIFSLVSLQGSPIGILLLLFYLAYALHVYRRLRQSEGSALNKILLKTSLGVLLLSAVHIISNVLSCVF